MSKKTVVMLSGGLDSYLAYRWAEKEGRDVLGIWVDIGQPYREKERAAVRSFGIPHREITCNILREEWDNVPTPTNQIIRARNGLLAQIGVSFGNEVWITALEGEIHPFMADKSEAFFELAGKFFSQSTGEKVTVTTPFAHMTKDNIVQWALLNGITPEEMGRTVTCYDPHLKACGECSACYKRWIAMSLNGINEPYTVKPWESEFAKSYIPKIIEAVQTGTFDHYSAKRCAETILAVHKQERAA